jgi:type II secretory pathway pseudopilin PulG
MAARVSNRGFTLLQVLVAIVLLALLLGVAAQSLVTGQKVMGQGTAMTNAQEIAQQVLNYMLIDLRETSGTDAAAQFSLSPDANTLSPAPIKYGDGFVHFKKNNGWNGSAITWVGPVEYYFEYDASLPSFTSAEVNGYGTDLNGNGRIDLGRIVRREQTGSGVSKTTIASNVLEGFGVTTSTLTSVAPNTLVIVKIATARQLSDRSVYVARAQEQVFLRN